MMKKIYLSIAVAMMLAGCMNTKTTESSKATVTTPRTGNLIGDPQFTKFRQNQGSQDEWRKEVPGSGKVGSSKDTAFDDEGSARVRFTSKDDNFKDQPGISQTVHGLQANTNYKLSMYLSDKRGISSNSQLIVEVLDLSGELIDRHVMHAADLANAKRGAVKSHFRQSFLAFNSGPNTSIKIRAKLNIIDPSQIDLNGDIGKQTEIRIDEFSLTKI